MALIDYEYNGKELQVTEDMKQTYTKHGYVLVRKLFNKEEINKLKDALDNDEGVLTKSYDVLAEDGERSARMCLWGHPGNDITGMVARVQKTAGTMEELMGGEVYHYHTKLMMKEAKVGGNWVWHQDYGYWYDNGILLPEMATCFIAVDQCTKENGCMEIIPETHHIGRINHGEKGRQKGADMEKVNHAIQMFGEPIPVPMEPGDALFFHCNLLHRSGENNSDLRRWAFLVAYNRRSNNPIKKHQFPRYTPLHKVENTAVETCEATTDIRGKGFAYLKKGLCGKREFIVEEDHLN